MFTLLHSSMNQEPLEKYVCIEVVTVTMKSADSAMHPSYRLQLKYPFASLSAMFNSMHNSLNQELFENHLCNRGSHYEKYGTFPLRKGSHRVQPPNQHMNGTQRRTLESP